MNRKLALVVALGVLLLGHVCVLPADDHPHHAIASETIIAVVHVDGLHGASCDGTLRGSLADAPLVLSTSRLPGTSSDTAPDLRTPPVELSSPPHLLRPPLLI